MQLGDEVAEARGQDDQVAGGTVGFVVGMGHPGGDEDGGTCLCIDLAILKAEGKGAFEDDPGLIVGMVNMQVGWTAAGPFVDVEGPPGDIRLVAIPARNDDGADHGADSLPKRRTPRAWAR